MAAGAPLIAPPLAIMGGAALLLWPAFLNSYPLVFSDTGGLLAQTVEGWAAWDKPFVYGPLAHLFHWRWSLWPVAVAQALLLSWLVWLLQRLWCDRAGPARHLGVIVLLAAGTAAPWFASLLLPDMLASALVMSLALLGFGDDRVGAHERWALGAVAMLAAAAHLSHLPVAAALVGLVALRQRGWRPVIRVTAPLAAAVMLLVVSNAIVQGRASVSPYGSVFLLARLAADGPASRTLAQRCGAATPPNWRLCSWVGRLPHDADDFLWRGDGPVWSDPGGPIGLAPEADAIIRATLLAEPFGVVRAVAGNTLAQLGRFRVGDTLGPEHLEATVGRQLAFGFPPSEQSRFAAGRQAQGELSAAAAPLLWPHPGLLALAMLGFGIALARAADPLRLSLLLVVPVALLVNAAVTGGLSGPHDRYQARIIWLLPLAAVAGLTGRRRVGPTAESSAPMIGNLIHKKLGRIPG